MNRAEALALLRYETEALERLERDPETAGALFDGLLQVWPNRLRSLLPRAKQLSAAGDGERALPYWLRLRDALPDALEPGLRVAEIHFRARRLDEAGAAAEAALKRFPSNRPLQRLRDQIADGGRSAALPARRAAVDAKPSPSLHLPAAWRPSEGSEDMAALAEMADADAEDGETSAAAAAAELERDLALEGEAAARRVHARTGLLLKLVRRELEIADPADLAGTLAVLRQAAARQPPFMLEFARLQRRAGLFHEAVDAYAAIAEDGGGAPVWREAADAAVAAGRAPETVAFTSRLLAADGASAGDIDALRGLLTAAGPALNIGAAWLALARHMVGRAAGDAAAAGAAISCALAAIRRLEAERNAAEAAEVALLALGCAGPPGALMPKSRDCLLDIVRRGSRAANRAGAPVHRQLWQAVERLNDGSAAGWFAVGLAAGPAEPASLEALARALDFAATAAFDPNAEIAAHHAAHGELRPAFAALAAAGPAAAGGAYRTRLAPALAARDFLGDAAVRYPECLLDVVWEEARAVFPPYEPRPGIVAAICGSLGRGGGERQLMMVLRAWARDPRIARVKLMIRSTARAEQRAYLPEIETLDLDRIIYGENWKAAASIEAEAPELGATARLRRAVDLLPPRIREDIVRVVGVVRRERPAAVYIRQDMPWAALAAMIAGASRVVTHRGSLSADHWDYDALTVSTTVRPMRRVYETLLRDPRYVIVNNSRAGRDSDMAFAATGAPEQHVVVYNGVEWAEQGETGVNLGLRAKLGIPADSAVLGGVFRIAQVKRPLLWLDVAQAVLRRRADAHFIIAGGGSMLAEVRACADRLGFGQRLHTPGEVDDAGAWFRAMDVSLLTSEREGMPNVVIESQLHGVPAVSAGVGGAAEAMIPGETGAIVPADATPETFADAIMPFLSDEGLRKAAGAKGAAFVRQRFSVAAVVDQLIEVMRLEAPGR